MVVCGSDSKHFVITLKSFCDKRCTTNALQRETATKNRVQKCLVEFPWHIEFTILKEETLPRFSTR